MPVEVGVVAPTELFSVLLFRQGVGVQAVRRVEVDSPGDGYLWHGG